MPFAFFPPSDGIQTLYPGTTSGINPENAQKIQKMPENAGAPVSRSLGEQAGEDRVELTAPPSVRGDASHAGRQE
jgi:hypothetical protein